MAELVDSEDSVVQRVDGDLGGGVVAGEAELRRAAVGRAGPAREWVGEVSQGPTVEGLVAARERIGAVG